MALENQDIRFSFSGIIFSWILLTLFFISFFYPFFSSFFYYSGTKLSSFQTTILQLVWILWIPILTIPFLISLLPFQSIDYSSHAIVRSIFHKIIFFLTFPIVLSSLFIFNNFTSWNGSTSYLGFIAYWLIVWTLIFIWVAISLWLWELLKGKGSSLTIKRLKNRKIKNSDDIYSSNASDEILKGFLKNKERLNQNQTNTKLISMRWLTITMNMPFLILTLISILKRSGYFDLALLTGLTVDLFILLLSLSFYRRMLIQKNYSMNLIKGIETFLFGSEDISDNIMGYAFFFIFMIFAFVAAFYEYLPVFSDFLFFLSFLIYVLSIWNNQFKAILSKLF